MTHLSVDLIPSTTTFCVLPTKNLEIHVCTFSDIPYNWSFPVAFGAARYRMPLKNLIWPRQSGVLDLFALGGHVWSVVAESHKTAHSESRDFLGIVFHAGPNVFGYGCIIHAPPENF